MGSRGDRGQGTGLPYWADHKGCNLTRAFCAFGGGIWWLICLVRVSRGCCRPGDGRVGPWSVWLFDRMQPANATFFLTCIKTGTSCVLLQNYTLYGPIRQAVKTSPMKTMNDILMLKSNQSKENGFLRPVGDQPFCCFRDESDSLRQFVGNLRGTFIACLTFSLCLNIADKSQRTRLQ